MTFSDVICVARFGRVDVNHTSILGQHNLDMAPAASRQTAASLPAKGEGMLDSTEAIRKLVLNATRFSGLLPLARRFGGGLGAVLMLHRVTAACVSPLGVNRHLAVRPAFLDAVLAEVARLGYRFASMDEAVDRIRSRSCEPFVTVTADDGYRDNLVEALPVLERHGAPITIYVAPALIEGTVNLWWDVVERIVSGCNRLTLVENRREIVIDCATVPQKIAANKRIHHCLTNQVPEEQQTAFLRDLARTHGVDFTASPTALMDWEELRKIAAHPLVAIGAHSVHHYNLKRLSIEAARREIQDGMQILQARLGEKPRHLAYPYGYASAAGAREVELAKAAGYASAVTTRHGLIQAEHAGHLHALPRISVNGRYQQVAYINAMLSGVTTVLANRGKRVVTV
jgi:peptidoglycan/xylan/chitin deacetylase (PgdA/CDA1 family)